MWIEGKKPYKVYGDATFRSIFGCSPQICSTLWNYVSANHNATKAGARPHHLLWALHFLKLYNPVRASAAMIGCDAKTYRKWVWMILTILTEVDDVVRNMVYQWCNFAVVSVIALLTLFCNYDVDCLFDHRSCLFDRFCGEIAMSDSGVGVLVECLWMEPTFASKSPGSQSLTQNGFPISLKVQGSDMR
jgi:hypothetical protein